MMTSAAWDRRFPNNLYILWKGQAGGRNSNPRGYSWEFFVRVCRPVLRILTLIQTKKNSFSTLVFRPGLLNPYPFSDQEVATKRNIRVYIDRNNFIIAEIRTPAKRFFLSYSYIIETTNTFTHYRSSLVSHNRFQTITAPKSYPLGRHIPIWLI